MKVIRLFAMVLMSLMIGCAQVPKESVELSATVCRDMAEMRKSHIALVDIYYTGVLNDINVFIDNVYRPYLIQRTLADDFWKEQMLSAVESASKSDASGTLQKESLQKIEAFLSIVQQEAQVYKKLKLKPIQDQYASVLNSINSSYDQIHYANSIVTGHLASIVKVHDAQNKMLEKFDLKNIRVDVGADVSGLSSKLNQLTLQAKDKENKLDSIVSDFEVLLAPIK